MDADVNLPLYTNMLRRLRLVGVLILPVIFWVGYLTDFSWYGTIADLLFPFIAYIVFEKVIRNESPPQHWLKKLVECTSRWLGQIGVISQVVTLLLFVFPPFLLWGMFFVAEWSGEEKIQEVDSPDGGKIALVYFRPTGSYVGGSGRALVRIRYKWVPLIEKDVYILGASSGGNDNNEFLEWIDDDTLLILLETDEIIAVDRISFTTPIAFDMVFLLFGLIISLE